MFEITKEIILANLSKVLDPDLGKDLVSLGMIKDVVINGKNIALTVELTTPACPLKAEIEKSVREALSYIPEIGDIKVNITGKTRGAIFKQEAIYGVKNVIAVASGKGGVGKSTVSVNIAVALSQSGARVGILDADIYGPTIPQMMGVYSLNPPVNKKIEPAENYNVKIMSIGFLIKESDAVIWRGPMIAGVVQQFLREVNWGELDYLIVDLPPGTGDAQLTLAQNIPVTGAVIVMTPQKIAVSIASKAITMFNKLNVPILGIIENMSFFICNHCHEKSEIFSNGGGEEISKKFNTPFLGKIPIDIEIREGADGGLPILISKPDSPQSASFREISGRLAAQVSIRNFKSSG